MIIEKNIHKFITHVVNNLFPLNERRYAPEEIALFKNKFKIEADDLNIDINVFFCKLYFLFCVV